LQSGNESGVFHNIAHYLFSLGEFYFVENKRLHEIIYTLIY
jgi:hypothetical protein